MGIRLNPILGVGDIQDLRQVTHKINKGEQIVTKSWLIEGTVVMKPTSIMLDHAQSFVLHSLVSFSVQNKQLLCFAHGQGQKGEQKHIAKNFVEFGNHSLLLTLSKE